MASDSSLMLGNADINASGNMVFHGFPADGSEGIFSSVGGIKVIADTNNPAFVNFLDPVINDPGTAASGAFLNAGGVEVFTGTAAGITPRTNPASSFLTFVDNVSINNSGDVARPSGRLAVPRLAPSPAPTMWLTVVLLGTAALDSCSSP